MQHQHPSKPQSHGKAEHVQVFTRENQIEICKFDKEARQDYVLSIPEKEYHLYASQGVPIEKAFPHLAEEQRDFLRSHLTPGEQRIVRDPAYQETSNNLMRAPAAAFETERAAILERANRSQLEPYDYKLSLRHQAFNAALRARPDLNRSMGEIEWVREISQAQYRSQLSRDPSFNPEVRLSPAADWTKNKLNGRIFADPANSTSERAEPPSGVQTLTTPGQLSRTSPVLLVTNTPNNHSEPDQSVSAHAGLSTIPPGNPTTLDSPPDNPKSPDLITRSILGSSAKTFPAQTSSGVYRGAIIAETQTMVLQRLSAYSVIAHRKELFSDEHVPKVGTNVCVSYCNAKPLVRELPKREKTMEVGR